MATMLGKRGRVMTRRGRARANNQPCRDSCCGPNVCATVYPAESCIPTLPPINGCEFVRPPDIWICTDTLCADDQMPVMPGDTVRVNGQCYQVQTGASPRALVPPGDFVYDLPTVECLTDCEALGCIPVSPFSLAEPCLEGCPPLYFCRSQFTECRTIRVERTGQVSNSGPGCCYRFDPGAAPAFPPDGAQVCAFPGGAIPTIAPSCDVIDFGGQNTSNLGSATCCECGDRSNSVPNDCDHFIIPPDGGIPLCNPPDEVELCCPTVLPQTRIQVSWAVRITYPPGSPFGGPNGFAANWTTATGTLAPGAFPPGSGITCDPGGTQFIGTITRVNRNGPLVNGQPTGEPFIDTYEGAACFCPLRLNTGLLPTAACVSSPGAPDYITCECLESDYSTLYARSRCFCEQGDGTPGVIIQTTDVEFTVQVLSPGPPPLGCEGGCNGRSARQQGGSDNGGIRIRGGGSRTLPFGVQGMVNVEEWL